MANEVQVVHEFMTTAEVANRLNVHRFTVYMLLKSGRLRGFKLRHAWRISRAEFNRFTASDAWTLKDG